MIKITSLFSKYLASHDVPLSEQFALSIHIPYYQPKLQSENLILGKREAVSDSGCSREMDESSSKRQKLQKKPWTSSEMNSIHKHFSHFITMLKVPGKNDVTNVLKKDKNLSKRTWRNVRDQVYNLIKKQRKC